MSSRDIIFAAAGGSPVVSDPNFEYVTLLLDGNGTNGGQNNTFIDSSTNNFTITRNGNTTQGSFSPYGTLWSNYFDGSGDYLNLTGSSIGSSNYTLEYWIYPTSSATLQGVFSTDGGTTTGTLRTGIYLGKIYVDIYNGTGSINIGSDVPLNQWNHIAVTKSGSSYTSYLNGVVNTTWSDSTSVFGTAWLVGMLQNTSNFFTGYVSNLRLVVGSVVYTGAFTPSTTPLTAITNTSLLTCQSNRFIDNSSNAFAITVNGSPSVQRFSPFEPSAPYSTSVIGGSGYFDGTTDYLSSTSVPVNFGTGAYTIEGWFYCQSADVFSGVFSSVTLSGSFGVALYVSTDGRFVYYEGNGSNGASVNFYTTMANYLNQWIYFACVDTGSTRSLYLNGVQVASDSTGRSLASQTFNIGSSFVDSSADTFPGYITNVRVSNIARYTGSTMSVPTAQLTADGNTIYFAKMENASIFDYAMMNNVETAGNAQISTSVKKFGTGSLAFDGTGDYLPMGPNPAFAFGTGDFTIEFWMYSNDVSSSTQRGMLQISGTAGGLATNYSGGLLIYQGANGSGTGMNGGITAIIDTNQLIGASTPKISTGSWYHIALVRNSGTFYLYVDGVSIGSKTVSRNITGTNLVVGGYYDTNYLYNGYLDDVRITKGIARYPSGTTFTPPTKAFPTF